MKRLDGHVWGDRYWSKVLEGEPPEEGVLAKGAGRGDCGEESVEAGADRQTVEARSREGPPYGDSHRAGEMAENNGSPPDSPRRPAL
jgi:hypothetical protein